MKTKTISIAIVIIAIGLIVWRLVGNKKEIDSKKEVKTEVQNIMVNIATVSEQMPSGWLEFIGTAEAYQDVMVPAEAAGTITGVNFKLGDYVSKGATLARIDDKYKTLALETAQINHDKTKDDYERYQKMRAGDAVSETQLRDARIAYESAKIQLDQTKKQLEDTRITAPFSGYITSKKIEQGAFINIGSTVAEMADISRLKVVISVPESDVYLLKEGQPVKVSAKVYPEAVYNGKISHISPKGDQAHTYPVEIIIDNNPKYQLKAGTYINAQIDRGSVASVLAIPRNGIVSSVKNPSVYMLQADNTVKLTPVTIGKDIGNYIEVLAGLEKGDQIVTNGQINLMDGSRVQVAEILEKI